MVIKLKVNKLIYSLALMFFLLSVLLTYSQVSMANNNEAAVHLQGIVVPSKKIKLSFTQSGIITLLASSGSLVDKGQIIAKLDDNKARSQLKKGLAEHSLALSELASANHDRDKSARLVADNILSDVALLEANFSVEIAKQRLLVAQATLELAEASLAECIVIAPFTGAVVDKNANVGEWMNAGDPFIEFVNLGELNLSIDIPPEMVSGLSVGLSTQVMDKGLIVGQAKLKTIFPVIDPASGLRRIVWKVVPDGDALLTGRYVSLASWLPANGGQKQ